MDWNKCDLHIHSQFSDGELTVREIVDLYANKGFGAIAVTDHLCEQNNFIGRITHRFNYSLSRATFDEYMATIRRESRRAWLKYNMLLIPGYEITKNSFTNQRSAHILVLGTEDFIDPELEPTPILSIAKSKGALTIAAHPFDTGSFEFQTFYLWSRRKELKNLIDAWEVNHRQDICGEVMGSGLPLIANSDFHRPKHFNAWKTKVLCDRNQNSVFEGIRTQQIDFFIDS